MKDASTVLKNGATVVERQKNVVLCDFHGQWVTWYIDDEGNAYWGHYCGDDFDMAVRDFQQRVEESRYA